MILTLARRYPSALTYLEEHHALFDQVCPLLEPNIRHNEAFFTITYEKPSNFGQALKGPDQVNWIKCSFAKNMITAHFLSSLIPLYMLTYPAQTAPYDMF